MMPGGRASISSHSDVSDYEHAAKLHLQAHRNFPSRHSFLAKPIHPLSFPMQTPREASEGTSTGFSEYDATTPQREPYRLSSGSSSIDLADIPAPFDSENTGRGYTPGEGFKCGLCDRFLSQRSPWSSRRIMRSGDMPVTGVLSCKHVFHAECLEQVTSKAHKNDPPCPICSRIEDENSPEQLHAFAKSRNSFPRLKSCADENSSRPWGCAQAGDCVEGALQAPHRSSMLLFNRDRLKKNFSTKGNPGKEFPGKLRKMSSHPLQLFSGKFLDHGPDGCSKTGAGPSVKR